MATIDPSFGVGWPDYSQTGSFFGPVSPPALGPFDGPLVALPCINYDWLRLLLGASDQLRNPSTWAGLTPTQTVTVLSQVEQLQAELSRAGTCVICPEMRLQDCVLQFSCDGGATWLDVTGWAANFDNCVSSVIIPPVPPNPGGDTTAQRACNIAGYISQVVIKDVITNAVTAYNSSLTQLEFGLLIFDTIAFAFPITAIAVDVFAALYLEFTAMTIADFTAAQTDPVLASDLTCAIYSAIAARGYIDAANLPAVIANVCAMSYVSDPVVDALCGFFTNVGLQNLQAMQNVGALDVVDCTSCGTWCYKWDGSTGNTPPWDFTDHPFFPLPLGQYVPGTGFTPTVANPEEVYMGITFTPTFLTEIEYTTDRGSTNNGATSHIEIVGFATVSFNPASGLHTGILPVNTTVGHVRINLGSAPTLVPPQNITSIIFRGTGSNPFGSSNCT